MVKDFMMAYKAMPVLLASAMVATLILIGSLAYKHKTLKKCKGDFYNPILETMMALCVLVIGMFLHEIDKVVNLSSSLLESLFYAPIAVYIAGRLLLPLTYASYKSKEEQEKIVDKMFAKMDMLYVVMLCIFAIALLKKVFFWPNNLEASILSLHICVLVSAVFVFALLLIGYFVKFHSLNVRKIKLLMPILTSCSSAAMLAAIHSYLTVTAGEISNFPFILLTILFCFLTVTVHYLYFSFIMKDLKEWLFETIDDLKKR